MLTHPRSTLCVLCKIMQLRSGHVTLLRAEFQPPKLSSFIFYILVLAV